MTWTSIPLGPALGDVVATVGKSRVTIILAQSAIRALGWTEEESNVTVALGDGDNNGWLLVQLDEDGATLERGEDGRIVLALPRSTLPDLTVCRASPLVWRRVATGGAIEVRLPTVGAPSRKIAPSRPGLRAVPSSVPAEDVPHVDVIAAPDLYKQLQVDGFRAGVEIAFLSDGNVIVNGRVMTIEEMESTARRMMEKARPDPRAA